MTSTQKQINELNIHIVNFRFVVIATSLALFIMIVAILSGMSIKIDDLQSQLSHKADRICVNETVPDIKGNCSDEDINRFVTEDFDQYGNSYGCLIHKTEKEVCTIK
jgi:hypothetical protein